MLICAGCRRCLTARARSKYQNWTLACDTTLCNVSNAGVQVNGLYEPKSYSRGGLCRLSWKPAEFLKSSVCACHTSCVRDDACASRLLGNCVILQEIATLSLIIIIIIVVWCNYWITGIISFFITLEKDFFSLLHWRKFHNNFYTIQIKAVDMRDV
jgi:hypothetical protein